MIHPDFQEVAPDYLIPEIKQHYKLYRNDKGKDRYYFEMDSKGVPTESYMSVTSMARNLLPTSEHLIKWQSDLGYENAQVYKFERAEYGTLYHIKALDYFHAVREGREYKIDRTTLTEFIFEKSSEKYKNRAIPHLYMIDKWAYEMEKDLLCWMQFLKDRLVKVIAIEFAAKHSKWGVVTTIDLIADIEFNRKTVRAIIDLKSGKKGFFKAHEFQLQVGKLCWNDTFKEHQVTHLFNFSPHEFNVKKVADGQTISKYYKFVNQTGNQFGIICENGDTLIEKYLQIAKATKIHRPDRNFYAVDVSIGDVKDFDINKAVKKF